MTQMPAFPNSGAYGHTGDYLPEAGMSLRDWFAGQALPTMIALNRDYLAKVSKSPEYPFEIACATDSYKLADAMLAARATTASKEGE